MNNLADRLTRKYLNTLTHYFPVEATNLGIHESDSQIGAFDDQTIGQMLNDFSFIEAEASRSVEGLSLDDKIDLRLIINAIKYIKQDFKDFKLHQTNPVYFIEYVLNGCLQLLIRDFDTFENRAVAIIERLKKIPGFVGELKNNIDFKKTSKLQIRTAHQISLSAVKFLNQIQKSEEIKLILDDRGTCIFNRAKEAFSSLAKFFLQNEKKCLSEITSIGEERFTFRLKNWHMINDKPENLVSYARSIIEQSTAEMRAVSATLNGQSDLSALIKKFSNERPLNNELLDLYRKQIEKSISFAEQFDIVSIPENFELDIIETPIFQRPLVPVAAYLSPGPFEQKQKGFFLVTLPDRKSSRNKAENNNHALFDIPVIALHEAFPGHHLQLSISNNAGSDMKKISDSPLFAEGWALYCEEMMDEFGYYEDIRNKFFQLSDQLLRACRTVVDVMVHCGEMTFNEAKDYFTRKAYISPSLAEDEVRQVVLYPGLQLSYLIGKREILRLRENQKKMLGQNFDLKDFHNQLLKNGSVPFALVEESFKTNTPF
jgi:uncharacterized protein (DUF885 family)